ncbi:MAG: MBL fold metallo-hydrolase RNA specificity domain-containing protein, partial [Halobacteria archaeon]
QQAGHLLGSSLVHLHIGQGLHNIVYTGDLKFGRTRLFDAAFTNFQRVETLITESTSGGAEDVLPPRQESEQQLLDIVNKTMERNGQVLIPSFAVGRAQEVMLILDNYMRTGLLREVPIFIEGMINEVTAIHTAYPEYLSRELRDQILHQDINPFQSEYFTIVKSPDERDEIVNGGPCVILATSGMLEGGPVLDYFKRLAEDPRNTLIFVSYQIEGTLGRRIQHGLTEVSMINSEGKMEILKRAMRVESVEGLSGHSDRNQIINYVRRVAPKPERAIIYHGERAKCIGLANALYKITRIDSIAPENLETIKLR